MKKIKKLSFSELLIAESNIKPFWNNSFIGKNKFITKIKGNKKERK